MKSKLIILILIISFCLIGTGIYISMQNNVVGDDGFIVSTTVYQDSLYSGCSSVSAYFPDVDAKELHYEKYKVLGKYINKEIKNNTKPAFADFIYHFTTSDGKKESYDGIKFDLGGGMEYYYSTTDDRDMVDKYSCYSKYVYNDKTKILTLYPDKNMGCDDMINKNKTAKIKLVDFKVKGKKAYLTLDFNTYKKTFTSDIDEYKNVDIDVSGTYVVNSKCSINDSIKNISEELVLNSDYTGTYKVNDKVFNIVYYVVESNDYDSSEEEKEIFVYVYSENEGVYFMFVIYENGLIERSELKGYLKIK